MTKQIRSIILTCLIALILMAGALGLASCGRQKTASMQALEPTPFTFQSAVVTNTNGSVMDVTQIPALGVQVEGIVDATVTFEASIDEDTWYAVEAVNRNDGSKATSTTADGVFALSVAEFAVVRSRVSSWVSGTITVEAIGLDGGVAAPADVSLAAATSGTYIGDVELIASPTVTNVTGAAAINVDYAPGSAFWLESVTLNLSAAPTTSQNFTIVLDAGDGAAYDTTLYSGDLSVIGGGVTDLVYQPALEMLFESTDEIDVDFTNTDVVTYGLRVVVRLAE